NQQTSLYATYTPAPVNELPPSVTGIPKQGQTLAEVHGTWTNEPSSFTYQWLQCDSKGTNCAAIADAMRETNVPVSGDVGRTLKVAETASNEGGTSSPAASNASAAVTPPTPTSIEPPTITGTAQQGQTLTEHEGTWTNEPTSFTYQWLQCGSKGTSCSPIAGATAKTYVPVAADVGHTIRVQESASNAGGTSSPATSTAASAAVLPAPPASVSPPSISGIAQQGQTLTEVHGEWENNPTSFTYQWLQCGSKGATCSPIAGATGQTYVPSALDVGHTLRVRETASNEGGTRSPATSGASALVVPPPQENAGG